MVCLGDIMAKSKQSEKKVTNNTSIEKKNAILYLTAGAGLFILRYIPTVKYGAGPITKWYSVDAANAFCGSFFGMIADNCNWIKPLNIVMIIASLTLIGWGLYSLYVVSQK